MSMHQPPQPVDCCRCADIAGTIGEKDLCGERESRYQEREFNGTKVNGGTSKVAAGTGRATVSSNEMFSEVTIEVCFRSFEAAHKKQLKLPRKRKRKISFDFLQVTHHHGMASTSSMDGWAEQFFCFGESKMTAPPACGLPGLTSPC